MKALLSAIVFACLLSPAFAQDDSDKAKAKQIRSKIEALQKQIADLQKELVAIEGSKYIGPVKDGGRFSLTTGDKGNFGSHRYRVEEVIGLNITTGAANAYVCRVEKGSFRFLVAAKSSGIADGSFIKMEGNWEVTGPGNVRGATMFYVRPLEGAKAIPD